MKYPFKTVINEVAMAKRGGETKWTIKSAEFLKHKKTGDVSYGVTYRFPVVATREEAIEMLNKVQHYRLLATDDLDITPGQFKRYYGCAYCADALDKRLEPIADRDDNYAQPMFCSHTECPYAEQIENADGYTNLVKDQDNFCFASLFENIDYFD